MLLGGILLLAAAVAVLLCLGTGLWWLLPVWFVLAVVALLALAFGFLWVMCQIVDPTKPQAHDSKFYRTMLKLYIQLLVKLLRIRIHTVGTEKIPQAGRFLLVSNHIHDSDPAVFLHTFPRSQLAFISKREASSMFLVGKIMHKLLCQPINRENDREALKTILKCIQLIKDDEVSIAVFPEGYIRPNRKLHHFRHGVFKIATKAKVPIVVCTLQNTNHIFENALKLKPTDVHLHLLTVIQPEEYADMTTVELSEKIYDMMADDLGPELVDETCTEAE